MPPSSDTKVLKKQSSSDAYDRQFEKALLGLESACFSVANTPFIDDRNDTQGIYWQRILKKIATPVSLALMECKGPRHFHHHYKHREDDETVLTPVLEDPIDMLAQVCAEALKHCQLDLFGTQSRDIIETCRELESALGQFLECYKKSRNGK